MVARRPYVRVHARTRWSDAAFDALYGLDGRYGEFSPNRAGSSNARSVHFVGTDVVESHVVFTRGLQQPHRALHVRADERFRVEDGIVVM